MRDYTPDELRRGRFLRHFMGLDKRIDEDPTDEMLAIPAGAEFPKTRETVRPGRMRRAS